MTSDFVLFISHGWVVTFPDSHRKVFTFRSWLEFRCCTVSVLDFYSINLQITPELLTQEYFKNSWKIVKIILRTSVEIWWSFVPRICVKEISYPVFYGNLVYKLRRVKDTQNFITSGSKIGKRLRRRQYHLLIIESTIGFLLSPSTALYTSFLKHWNLTNKVVGTIWLALFKPSQRRQGI